MLTTRLQPGLRMARAALAVPLIAFALTPLLPASPARALACDMGVAEEVWVGSSDGNWSNAANWSGNVVPTATDDVCIPSGTSNEPLVPTGVAAVVADLDVQQGATLTVDEGSLTINGSGSVDHLAVIGVGASVTVGDASVDTLTVSNFVFEQGTIHGPGTLTLDALATLATPATKTFALHVTNAGDLTWLDGNIEASGVSIDNSGIWDAQGTADALHVGTIENTGHMNKLNSGTVTVDGDIDNAASADITIDGGATLSLATGSQLTQTGTVHIGDGTFDLGSNTYAQSDGSASTELTHASSVLKAATISISGGSVDAVGALIGNINFTGGSLAVGNSPGVGTLAVTGNFTQVAPATLQLDATSLVAATGYDTLAVTGAVTLTNGPTLQIDTGSFDPAGNDAFDFVSYGSITGAFNVIDDLTGDFYYGTIYGPSPLTLSALESGSIAGTVFTDDDSDGVFDQGEQGIAGVVVFVDLDNDGVLDAGEQKTATTGPDGAYLLADVAAGTHDIDALLPTGAVRTTAALDSVVVASNQDVVGKNIGSYRVATITGKVFSDLDGDGLQDPEETTGVASATVFLDADGDDQRDIGETNVATNSEGEFAFANVAPGSHKVRLDTGGSGAVQTSPLLADVTVPSDQTVSGLLIGLDVLGQIQGMIYEDVNGNGIKDSADTAGLVATVYLDADHDGLKDPGERTARSSSSGVYTFSQVPAGTYDVDVIDPLGYDQSSSELNAVVVVTNQDLANANVGMFRVADVAGVVYDDSNENGSRESYEDGVQGVLVYNDVDNDGVKDNGEATATSNEDGEYVFTSVTSGTYRIRVVVPPNSRQTTASPDDVIVTSNVGRTDLDFGLDIQEPPANDPTSRGTGYWMVGLDGKIYNFGDAQDLGSPADMPSLNAPVIGMAPHPDGSGYWAVAVDGGVFSYGDSKFHGSMGGQHLNEPIVGMAPTPSGDGYWMVATDGGIFSFGDAQFFGSMGGQSLNEPVVGMVPTPSGHGYWLVASDGGIFSFGDARFFGSMGGHPLNSPVVGIASALDGDGYWMVAADGGIFAFGEAKFRGSMGGQQLNEEIVNIKAIADGSGYWLIAADGGVFSFGSAHFLGNPGENVGAPIIG